MSYGPTTAPWPTPGSGDLVGGFGDRSGLVGLETLDDVSAVAIPDLMSRPRRRTGWPSLVADVTRRRQEHPNPAHLNSPVPGGRAREERHDDDRGDHEGSWKNCASP
ncbi:MAG TPA: hypothetical protein VJT49_34280 [Amycolatopsis sp.]|nr:hypothetical protein [Amycolatopsis sp.]